MIRPFNALSSLVITASLLVGCETTTGHSKKETGRTVHTDSTTRMTAGVGETVEFGLPGNAGTGYTWAIAGNLPDCVKEVGEPYFKADHPDMPGSSGTTRFRFEAVKAGNASIRFEYARPWEKDARAARWSVVDITIGG
ncbi:MAG: protease inhibitor I42 family protein [Phycisphaerales bacterium]|nr:protease inhibitor I42 family protein [Phycisphaerales bacterium]